MLSQFALMASRMGTVPHKRQITPFSMLRQLLPLGLTKPTPCKTGRTSLYSNSYQDGRPVLYLDWNHRKMSSF